MKVKGRGGEIEFDGHFITIRHTGALGRMSVGKGDKRIPITSITAVQIKPAGAMVNGYIQFTLPGGNEKKAGFGKQTMDAAGDENSVIFTKNQEQDFLALRDAIEKAMVSRSGPQVIVAAAAGPSKLDQLKQIGELRDTGVLTPEEFEIEKTKIMTGDVVDPESSDSINADSSDTQLADDGSNDSQEGGRRGKIGFGRIAGAVATGGLSEAGRFAKKIKNKE
jgi:hypothetical protein